MIKYNFYRTLRKFTIYIIIVYLSGNRKNNFRCSYGVNSHWYKGAVTMMIKMSKTTKQTINTSKSVTRYHTRRRESKGHHGRATSGRTKPETSSEGQSHPNDSPKEQDAPMTSQQRQTELDTKNPLGKRYSAFLLKQTRNTGYA